MEKKISGSVVYSGSFLKVEKDEVLTAKGHLASREFITHPGASLIIPVKADGNLLMIKQFRYSMGQVYFEFPAGKLDPGEKPEAAALRELQEEIQMTSTNLKFLTTIHPCIGYSNEMIHLFLAQNLSPFAAKPDDDEDIEVITLRPAELRQKLKSHQLPDVKTQIAAWWYLDLLGANQVKP